MFDNLKNLIRQKGSKKKAQREDEGVQDTEEKFRDNERAERLLDNRPLEPCTETSLPEFPELSPRYTIVSRLGEGAFSKVYLATDNHLVIDVAIKVISKSKMTNTQLATVQKEISIMRRLEHPNIVKLYNYINTEERAFIVMEYVSGGELFNQIVKYTYFSEELSRHIIVQVVEAVEYLHSEVGVVHRDIKPENLLFEEVEFFPRDVGMEQNRRASDDASKVDEGRFVPGVGGGMVGRVKLADFGLSKVLWDSNTKTPCGTASYTAPEIVKDEAYSKSVDMWAVGCVLYTLLCGFPPFYDTDPKTLTLKVSNGEYTFLSPWWDEISKEAKDLVSHLLTVDPKERYSPDDVLNHPWILENKEPTKPALDAPVYRTRSDSVLRFEETIPTVQHLSYLSPRAEAMKFAFDTGISIQRTATPLRRLLEEDDYFNESDEVDLESTDDEDEETRLDSEEDSEVDSEDSEEEDEESKRCYKRAPIPTTSPIIKKFDSLKITPLPNTPHHFRRHCANTNTANKHDKNSVSSVSSFNSVHPVTSSSSSLPKTILSPIPKRSTSSQQFKFKEMGTFNLNFDGNTLLNRRRGAGSLACGPTA